VQSVGRDHRARKLRDDSRRGVAGISLPFSLTEHWTEHHPSAEQVNLTTAGTPRPVQGLAIQRHSTPITTGQRGAASPTTGGPPRTMEPPAFQRRAPASSNPCVLTSTGTLTSPISTGTFYYLCSILDGTSRALLHWEIRDRSRRRMHPPTGSRALLQRASADHLRQRTQFVARDFKEFIRIAAMSHVKKPLPTTRSPTARSSAGTRPSRAPLCASPRPAITEPVPPPSELALPLGSFVGLETDQHIPGVAVQEIGERAALGFPCPKVPPFADLRLALDCP